MGRRPYGASLTTCLSSPPLSLSPPVSLLSHSPSSLLLALSHTLPVSPADSRRLLVLSGYHRRAAAALRPGAMPKATHSHAPHSPSRPAIYVADCPLCPSTPLPLYPSVPLLYSSTPQPLSPSTLFCLCASRPLAVSPPRPSNSALCALQCLAHTPLLPEVALFSPCSLCTFHALILARADP